MIRNSVGYNDPEGSKETQRVIELKLQSPLSSRSNLVSLAAISTNPGEILITYCTDIGWSPYFPIISGVVTELGGLISHGAVVSREYGLPCVVGLQGATKKFQTGDYVLLDGKKGILQRLPQPE
ncbi:putative phosphoenolpyruvate synthase [Nephila pilipes]|uniref:Putative phosphoenolpyruvate synthase n=1 Tax=Nephila pilipes TaxID=299642 RepID=A0A8X6IDX9_NEPPI|nr:putative phosphoenolpyruvate synthase [Nephila pilipes]